MGTGNAWAWQNSAKLVLLCFTYVMLLASDGKVGGLEPMGSERYSSNGLESKLVELPE